ncbi:hypothetical protein KKD42_00015 [Patescibacteria group bacterium]|nr:hypothetical protein [Patescibacteria group bacterium]
MNLSWKKSLIIFIALFALLLGVNIASYYLKPSVKSVAREGVYAVFLTNGQVYFGAISSEDEKILTLNGIYYLQSKGGPTEDSLITQSDVSLLKLGNELHGPEDWMEISKQNVLFIEKLKSDSKVGKAIENYKNQ